MLVVLAVSSQMVQICCVTANTRLQFVRIWPFFSPSPRHRTRLCMTPAARWPSRCLHPRGSAHWTAAAGRRFSTGSVRLLSSEEASHGNQKISAMNVSPPEGVGHAWTGRRPHRTPCAPVRVIPSRSTTPFSSSAVLFFYWNCTWMFCAEVKCHFNTKAGVVPRVLPEVPFRWFPLNATINGAVFTFRKFQKPSNQRFCLWSGFVLFTSKHFTKTSSNGLYTEFFRSISSICAGLLEDKRFLFEVWSSVGRSGVECRSRQMEIGK